MAKKITKTATKTTKSTKAVATKKGAAAKPANAATTLMRTLFGGLAEAIKQDEQVAALAAQYGLTVEVDDLEEEEEAEEEEEEEPAPKGKGKKAAKPEVKKGKGKKAPVVEDDE